MARRPALSTSTGEELYVEGIMDEFTLLDIVYENQFEGDILDQDIMEETEANFYRGAPPEWLNFHINELRSSPFIKRDGYGRLVQWIYERTKGPGTSMVKLFHQQGSGGTTLAMQVLWDMRKTFRRAVLTGSTLETTKIAKEVVHLFTGGSEHDHNTVLLLLNNEFILDNLQDCIMAEITEQEVVADTPIVILFNCVRNDYVVLQKERSYKEKVEFKDKQDVILKTTLSDSEKEQFEAKKEDLSRRYGDKTKQFHGFNILQTDFSRDYIQEVCAIFEKTERRNKPLKMQLVAFLSLLNAYVPGSYLLESDCLQFLRRDKSVRGDLSLADLMQPFSHLILSYKHEKRREKKIQMAHPMIAKCCTKLLTKAEVTRRDKARNFLISFCKGDVSTYLLGFIKDLLTKREKKKTKMEENTEKPGVRLQKEDEDVEKYSRLILDITKKEDKKESASVLKVASNKFVTNPCFPQALARFCYRELKDYKEAEMWAKTAKERDPKKSFIADTLGQVHKNHLKNKESSTDTKALLLLAQKAIEAFEEEERLAEEEHKKSLIEEEKSKVLRELNTRGHFGFLQVCSILFDRLSEDKTWRRVLTNNITMGSALKLLGDNKLFRFSNFVDSLREKVEKKFEFFDTFLAYSVSITRKDKAYVSWEAAQSCKKYIGSRDPKTKQKLAVTSAGVLSCLDRRCTLSDVQHVVKCWEEMCQSKDSAFVNFILAKIVLSNKINTPPSSGHQHTLRQMKPPCPVEYHMLNLLLFWPTEDEDKPKSDLNILTERVRHAYEGEYGTVFRSRYLRPLFFIGPGKSLTSFVHRRTLEIVFTKDALIESNTNWRSENIFKDPIVQERLIKIEGVVRHYRVYATFRGTEVEVEANRKDSLWKSGDVTFYLGITIKGPVAFSIQRRLTIAEDIP
ncbi:sterile alpha motif domain-containing protein 9 [Nothobranchius furzeri]|uniref:sterile alpha motif domain-containing protein 9 n=1 Tax=Nothobranchius furzeri TaxID=105023 RepID=UPI003904A238